MAKAIPTPPFTHIWAVSVKPPKRQLLRTLDEIGAKIIKK